ncbi:unnamed protein product, partial [Mesorhabditis spiculigera]
MGDTVLFTTDEAILESIANNDLCLIHDFDFANSTQDVREQSEHSDALMTFTPYRPTTGELLESPRAEPKFYPVKEAIPGNGIDLKAKVLHIELLSNWGSRDSIGLTGLEILGPNAEVPNKRTQSIAQPSEMWLTPFDPSKPPTITINFPQPQAITGISFWNYNASPEMSKAPGFVFFDYVQDVPLHEGVVPEDGRSRPLTHSIDGFIFQLRLLSTWGDEFYVGLNGIELLDRRDRPLKLRPHNLAAFPRVHQHPPDG